jgi:hypothetical protein
MSKATADIVGTTGASFTCTIDAGTILSAYLEVPNTPIVSLEIADDEREVTLINLPKGQSWIRLDIVWAPGDGDADIAVGTVTSGNATAATPAHTLDAGNTPGYIELFGTKS